MTRSDRKYMSDTARDLIRWLDRRNRFVDVCIYVNGRRYSDVKHNTNDSPRRYRGIEYYVDEDIDIRNYIPKASITSFAVTYDNTQPKTFDADSKDFATLRDFFERHHMDVQIVDDHTILCEYA